jgi:Fe-coproporphyrin III synthase
MDIIQLTSAPEIKEQLKRISDAPDTKLPVLYAKIKLLWKCNLKCRFCSSDKADASLAASTVFSLLDQLKRAGTVKVHFSGGEVFLHPDIFPILERAVSCGFQVNLTSNGTLLDKEKIRNLAGIGVHRITLSLDGASASTHDAVRGVPGSFRKTVKSIGRIAEKGKKVRLGVNTVACRANWRELDNVHNLLFSVSPRISWRVIPVDSMEKKVRLPFDAVVQLARQAKRWELLSGNPFGDNEQEYRMTAKGLYAKGFYREHRCCMPWLHSFIDPEGNLFPCCMSRSVSEPLGNIKVQQLAMILSGGRSLKLKMHCAQGYSLPVCERCDDFIEENLMVATLVDSS